MRFEWDENKGIENVRKHGIRFEVAQGAFDDPFARFAEDKGNYGECRYRLIGEVDFIVLVVVYTLRGDEAIRLISARIATRAEKREYYGGN
jgi:uncharacterized protein